MDVCPCLWDSGAATWEKNCFSCCPLEHLEFSTSSICIYSEPLMMSPVTVCARCWFSRLMQLYFIKRVEVPTRTFWLPCLSWKAGRKKSGVFRGAEIFFSGSLLLLYCRPHQGGACGRQVAREDPVSRPQPCSKIAQFTEFSPRPKDCSRTFTQSIQGFLLYCCRKQNVS